MRTPCPRAREGETQELDGYRNFPVEGLDARPVDRANASIREAAGSRWRIYDAWRRPFDPSETRINGSLPRSDCRKILFARISTVLSEYD